MLMEQFYSNPARQLNIRRYLKIDAGGQFIYPRVVTLFPKTPDLAKDVKCFILQKFIDNKRTFNRNMHITSAYEVLYYV